MQPLEEAVDEAAARTGFSGVVRVDRAGENEVLRAYGLADRAHGIPNTHETLFATASGTKGLTALTVMALVERGTLRLDTTARSLLDADLPLIADDVTVEHLLAHRSGIGDYLDEGELDDRNAYVVPIPVHELTTTEQYVRILDGHATVSPAGERFAYNNSGYVVLALLAERASGVAFHELVRTLVCEPAGMVDTAFLRSDELPGRAALGYLSADDLRTNVLHLPVLGSGDGGLYSTATDFIAFWDALFAGRIVAPERVAEMVRPHSDWPEESKRYGLGFHLDATGDGVWLEGSDAGVSFDSLHQPSSSITYSVISNRTAGVWPLVRWLDERLGT
ncbi:serine hydrolase domain-containing protein [Nocardioides iriomotensis]|uniref:Class A beta-lactamase-related serine hydrolase n=1 Tax=Nocardioides iriomotensis TaxID=715784 RepID=A0A4Q5J0A5_9ACTN|nr:serine hydrolase domain-containing protein [Nocardioides iriomotensis]RYU10829.1 class A beta-lactamase-related serine hydrolase [Nocardioides iriomotensis]